MSLSEDESDPELGSELEELLELAFRLSWLVELPVKGITVGDFTLGASFSSSASLSELALDVDEDDEVKLAFLVKGFKVEDCFFADLGRDVTPLIRVFESLSSLLVSLLVPLLVPLIGVASALPFNLPFPFAFPCMSFFTCTAALSPFSILAVRLCFFVF